MPGPRRIRLQYSLRALAIFITLFMIWGGYHANRGWKQRAAETVLQRHDAAIVYLGHDTRNLGSYLVGYYKALMHKLWGDRHIAHVIVRSPLEPEVVEALIALPQMDGLAIHPGPITSSERSQLHHSGNRSDKKELPDGALERILARRGLRDLGFLACQLDVEDCRAIARCESIESLRLEACWLSDEGLAELLKLPGLYSLNIFYCQGTEDELGSVPGSTSLVRVEWNGSPVGKEFAAFVGRSPNVTHLHVVATGSGDEFISNLGAHPSLVDLAVGGVVTDAVAPTIEKMPSLEIVCLPQGSLSDEAKARLTVANPKLLILPP